MTPLRLVLLGDPVAHSRSPAIHRAALHHLGVEGDYQAVLAGVPELVETIRDLGEGRLDGANITMPLKLEAASRCDLLTPEALVAGSVNTLRARVGRIEGHSTDVVAARRVLSGDRFPSGAPLLVLGSGGAALAVVAAAGGSPVHVSARDPDKALRLLSRADRPGTVVRFGDAIPGAIVVNATPLGMHGETVPGTVLAAAAGLIDLAYGPEVTGSVRWAESHGLVYLDGVEFLALQAAASFEWWTGWPAPLPEMLIAAKKA